MPRLVIAAPLTAATEMGTSVRLWARFCAVTITSSSTACEWASAGQGHQHGGREGLFVVIAVHLAFSPGIALTYYLDRSIVPKVLLCKF